MTSLRISVRTGCSWCRPIRSQIYHVRWFSDRKSPETDDEALLESIIEEEEHGGGDLYKTPKYWQNKYSQHLDEAKSTMGKHLEEQFDSKLGQVIGFNKAKSQSPLQRITVDMKRHLTIHSLIDNQVVAESTINYLGTEKPSSFQKRLWSLMTGGLSSVAKGDQGSGRTTALAVTALNMRRNWRRGEGVNTLIIVKTAEMVRQYQRIVDGILGDRAGPYVAQYLYRTTTEAEDQQLLTLDDNLVPHVLVSTPQRLLDLLSTRGMDFIKINSLSAIMVDDFDTMIDSEDYLDVAKKPPVVQLLDYVVKLQDFRRQHMEPHPQLVFTVSNGCSESLLEQIKARTQWFDWQRFVPLGTFEPDTSVPARKSVATNVGVSTVLVDPSLEDGQVQLQLSDMAPFEYGNNMSQWLSKMYRSDEGSDVQYHKQRNTRRSRVPQSVKQSEVEILAQALKEMNLGRALVVYADGVADRQLQEAMGGPKVVELFDSHTDPDFFLRDGSRMLLISSSTLAGLTFKGLNRVVLLGIDSIRDCSRFVTIAGRCRASTGLVLDGEYSIFMAEPTGAITNRLYLLTTKQDLQFVERNYLERVLLKCGLVRQFASIGKQEQFDRQAYEQQFRHTQYSVEGN